jgi:hypothetical protein
MMLEILFNSTPIHISESAITPVRPGELNPVVECSSVLFGKPNLKQAYLVGVRETLWPY